MRIGFIGGGNMAVAIIGGLLARGHAAGEIVVAERDAGQRERLADRFGVAVEALPGARFSSAEAIVLAVKPQQMREAVAPLAALLGTQPVVSIAAGIRLADLSRWLGGYQTLVRAMPNTPALVHAGITGLHAAAGVTQAQREAATALLAAVGEVIWFEDEAMLDAVTAVSGSGPAYVFYFLEALEQAARELGLASADARQLAAQTFAGSVKLALAGHEPFQVLRERVTSKGGTTERALGLMQGAAVKERIVEAVKAACERSRELGDTLGRDP
jgi:pyrroline-5-carboxylate reductase